MKINKKFEFHCDRYELGEYFQQQVFKLQDKGFNVTNLVLNPETISYIMNKIFEDHKGTTLPPASIDEVFYMNTLGDPKLPKDEFRVVIEPLRYRK